MNCPNCGKEMEPGWLYANGTVFWSPSPDKLLRVPDRKCVSLRLCADAPAAYLCKGCRKMVVDF